MIASTSIRRLLSCLFFITLLTIASAPTADAQPAWVINEVLADPGAVNDANGDGNNDAVDDEFVEIVNLSGADADIGGWTISDIVRVRHAFPEGTIVPNECAIVVFGSGPIGRPFNGAVFQTASDGSLGFNNGGDTITLADLDGTVQATMSYGGDTGINASIDQSVNLSPDIDGGTYVAHDSIVAGVTMSPGTLSDGSPFAGCDDEPPPPPDTGWKINEFYAAPSGDDGDANQDETVDDRDEFVEILNLTGTDQDISNWILTDSESTRHAFLPGTIVPNECSVVVFGNVGEFPFNGATIQAASTGSLALDDDGDTIGLANLDGDVQARITYGAEGGSSDSRTRSPDGEGDFASHIDVTGSPFSPGTLTDGTTLSGCPDEPFVPDSVEIWEIQGEGQCSPIEDTTVLTTGNIVTAVQNDGFFIQTPEERTDGNIETSDGIFVYTAAAPEVSVGDVVDVVGDVTEFFDWTELTSPRITIQSNGAELPEPIVLDETRPSPDQPQSPNELERFENMLIEFTNGTVVNTSDRFGNFLVVAKPDRTYREPGIAHPGADGFPVWDGNPEIFEVDPNKISSGLQISPAAGARITRCYGPLAYRFERYRVHPVELEVESEFSPRPVPERVGGQLLIATQNLFGFFDDQDDPTRDDQVLSTEDYNARLASMSAWIRDMLRSPDIVAVQEAESVGVLQALADRINADDGSVDYTPFLVRSNDPGGRNSGFLVQESIEIDSVEAVGGDETFDLDGRTNDTFSRPPLVLRGTYTGDGQGLPLVLVNVHMRSLGGIDGDSATFVQTKRLRQAEFVADLAQTIQTDEPDVNLVIAGDFNAFEFTDGYVDSLGIITGTFEAGSALNEPAENIVDPTLRDHVLDLPARERYSTLFDGNAEALDHIVSSSAMAARLQVVAFARGNADAPSDSDRASDHDGMVAYYDVSTDKSGPDFKRGDTNADGNIDLSDPVATLNFLFTGGDAPPCRVAADANGAGRLELTSAIYMLNFLFSGGSPPPAPYPDCGEYVPARDDALGCESYDGC